MAKSETLFSQLPKAEQEREKKRLLGMSEKPVPQAKKQNGSFNLKGYIRCELSVSDKEAFKSWEPEQQPADVLGVLVKLVDSGYLLKVGESGQGYQASLCAATTGAAWDGYVLTAHAGTGVRAAALLVYKHAMLCGGDWSAWLDDGGEDFMR